MNDWIAPSEIQTIVEDTPSVQPLTPEQLAQMEADKLALQSEYTRTRQALIETTATVAKNDPAYINTIKDTKLQNAVVKQLYGFDTYEQAVAVLWNDFNAVDDGNGTGDRTEKLERELKLIKYNSQKSEVDNAIKDFKLSNPKFFVDPTAEEKLRSELQFVSSELAPSERVRRASAVAFVPSVDPTTLAYQVLNQWNAWNGGNGIINADKVKEEHKQKQIEAGRLLLGIKPSSK